MAARMQVVWTPQARQDRADIWTYLVAQDVRVAVRVDEIFSTAAARLAVYPHLGKPGLVSGTRELIVHENYRLVYEVGSGEVWVMTLVHTSRHWPPLRN